jgi:hypothetical protein
MRDRSAVLERGVEMDCPRYSFYCPEGLDSKHNLLIISSLLSANNGESDIVFDEETSSYVVPIYRMEQEGDIAALYTRGTHFHGKGLVLHTPPPQKTFLDTVGPIEIFPSRTTFVEEKDLDSNEIIFEDLNLRFIFKEQEGKALFTVSSTRESLFDALEPIEDIEMVQVDENSMLFGLDWDGEQFGEKEKYLQLREYIKKVTNPDGSLNGIRAKGVSLILNNIDTDDATVRIGISV